MLIGIVLFLVLRALVTMPFFEWTVINVSGIRYLLAIGIFVGVLIMIIPKMVRVGIIVIIASIILYAATIVLLPYYQLTANVAAAAIAIGIIVVLKWQMIPAVHKSKLNNGVKTILYLV